MRTYAIGDIHGQIGLLAKAHDSIARDRGLTGDAQAPVVHLGDLVDRGPDSRGVVEYLRSGIAQGQPWVVLKGNHDRMFAGYLSAIDWHDPGLRLELSYLNPRIGGAATLASYGVRAAADRPLSPRITAAFWKGCRAVIIGARCCSFTRASAPASVWQTRPKPILCGSERISSMTRAIMVPWWCMGIRRWTRQDTMATG
jgi:hypothetical protein